MKQNDIKKALLLECKKAGSQKAWAINNGLSQAFVSDVLLGKRDISQSILDALGYKMIVNYEAALKKAGTDKGAARLIGCKAITIKRRRAMWDAGKKLQLQVKAKKK